MDLHIRRADGNDLEFMREMLREAATGPDDRRSTEEVLADAKVAGYLAGWGRRGDVGVIAVAGHGQRLGAAWLRPFDAERPGYGFVDDETPELSIAVEPASRGRGIGGRLLDALLDAARTAGFARVSLSVAPSNVAAVHLYRSRGFQTVARDADDHRTMVASTTWSSPGESSHG